MSRNNVLEKIVIIDFGSQFTQLIARKVREVGVFSEIINFPTFIRRELISNVLSYPGLTLDFKKYVETFIEQKLEPAIVIEIGLLKDLKLRRFSMEEINNLANQSGLTVLH